MKNVTISSYRDSMEKLSFTWPDQLQNAQGEFVGKVVCNVMNPMFPKIKPHEIKWAVDTAFLASFKHAQPTVFNNLSQLKTWLNNTPLEINEARVKKMSMCQTGQIEFTIEEDEPVVQTPKMKPSKACVIL